MTNFIFKSSKGLIKNSPITTDGLDKHLNYIQIEQRHQRQDLSDIKRMLNKLLIDKHLQMQVDEYFEETSPQTDQITNEAQPFEDK